MGPCYKSHMIDFTEVANLDTPEIFHQTLNAYAEMHRNKKIIAIGCGDNYVKCLAQNKDDFRKNIILPYADYAFLED